MHTICMHSFLLCVANEFRIRQSNSLKPYRAEKKKKNASRATETRAFKTQTRYFLRHQLLLVSALILNFVVSPS
ncbi:hypothetical protein YC2023_047712 [Brassica napus]